MSKQYNKGTGLIHTRTRRKYRLITSPEEIYGITKRKTENPKPRCGGCKKPTVVLKPDLGNKSKARQEEVAQYCPRCKVIFPLYSVVVATYDY